MKTENIVVSPFKPRARMLLQLGEQLIKNESIAIIELVKNAYDADASCVTVTMNNIEDPSKGEIIIKDDGWGMDLETILNVWLEPGSNSKSQLLAGNKRSPKGRLPIGEKGIGRFGVHKLGNEIEMITKRKNGKECYVHIDWSEFKDTLYLNDIQIPVVERDTPLIFNEDEEGTILKIKRIKKIWNRGEIRDVFRAINSLSSPFESLDSFRTFFSVPGHEDWLCGIMGWNSVKDVSLYHFKATVENDEMVSFLYEFTPWNTMERISPVTINWNANDIINENSNVNLKLVDNFKFLKNQKGSFSLSDSRIKIGRVRMEGYVFDRDTYIMKLGITDKQGFKDYLKDNGGIRVYRDNLRVYDYGEPDNDWLSLDIRRVNQPAKRLSNNILLVAVYLDRSTSQDLKEKTNREGFIENKAYYLFKDSILHVIDLVEILRFEDKTKIRNLYGPTSKSEPVLQVVGDLKKYVEEKIKEKTIRDHINRYLEKIESDYQLVCDNLLKAAGAGLNMSVVVHEVEKIIYEVSTVLKEEKASGRAIKLVEHLSSLIDGYADIIRRSERKTEDILKVINNAVFNTEYRLKAHQIKLEKSYLEFKGDTSVKVSRSLLIGAMMNLIDNSIYWLEQKKPQEKKIYIGIEETGKFINVIFADNGPGFLLPTNEITEPFVSAKKDGIGLGLHIASEVMLAQKGNLSFPSYNDVSIPQDYKFGAIVSLSIKK
jgi:anti-sigma regulatory factor (Ser/Thr protein kinase)